MGGQRRVSTLDGRRYHFSQTVSFGIRYPQHSSYVAYRVTSGHPPESHYIGYPVMAIFFNTIGDDFITPGVLDRKSTRLNSSHMSISYAVFCLKKNTCWRTNSAFSVSSVIFTNNIIYLTLF